MSSHAVAEIESLLDTMLERFSGESDCYVGLRARRSPEGEELPHSDKETELARRQAISTWLGVLTLRNALKVLGAEGGS